MRAIDLKTFLAATLLLLGFAARSRCGRAQEQRLADCRSSRGCTVGIVYSPEKRSLAPREGLPLLIPGDKLTLSLEGNPGEAKSLGTWHCKWDTEEKRSCGIFFTCKTTYHNSQDFHPQGTLGQQIRLSAFLEREKLADLNPASPSLGPQVLTTRVLLVLGGSVAQSAPRGGDCQQTQPPPSDLDWYRVRIVIVRPAHS